VSSKRWYLPTSQHCDAEPRRTKSSIKNVAFFNGYVVGDNILGFWLHVD
jgi:hypothetical protein